MTPANVTFVQRLMVWVIWVVSACFDAQRSMDLVLEYASNKISENYR
jgi:hypothetical protein